MLSRGSTTSGSHTLSEPHEADFTGREITQGYDYKSISQCHTSFFMRTEKCAMLCHKSIAAAAKMYVLRIVF